MESVSICASPTGWWAIYADSTTTYYASPVAAWVVMPDEEMSSGVVVDAIAPEGDAWRGDLCRDEVPFLRFIYAPQYTVAEDVVAYVKGLSVLA